MVAHSAPVCFIVADTIAALRQQFESCGRGNDKKGSETRTPQVMLVKEQNINPLQELT